MIIEEAIEKSKNNKELLERFEKLKRLRDKKHKTKKDIEEIMRIGTCWEHLAYCCKCGEEGKKCIFRDTAAEALGFDHKKLEKYKKECKKLLLKMI